MSTDKLIFVRHSAVKIDPAVPSRRWRLSANGRSRAAALAAQLAAYTPTRIVTSEEPKAVETGQIMAGTLGLSCTAVSGLQEHARANEPYTDDATFRASIAQLLRHPNDRVYGSETGAAARQRMTTAVARLTATHPDDTLIIVTHGTVLTLFLSHHNPQLDPIPFWQRLTLPAAFVVSLPGYRLQHSHYQTA